MTGSFFFHYVRTPTGEISGASFMQQTEDVINDLGKFATESTQDSTEALRIAKEAMSTADTANANSATALATSNSAISVAKSLQLVVDGWEPKLEQAVADASQAVKTAQAAEANSTQALGTANAAKSKSDQAIVTANSALAASNTATTVSIEARDTANSAIEIARQAVVDVSADVALMKGLVATATERAENASISAGVAQTARDLAQKWANYMDGTVDETEYSAKWYATKAADSETVASTASASATAAADSASASATGAQQSMQTAQQAAAGASASAQAAAESAKVAAFAVRLTSTNVSASGTAALTSLTPSANVKVGDTVIDPDGEVFQIASIASSTFTVGARLANVRGPQGPKGETGAALAIKGSFPSLEELQEQHPTGTLGDAYMVGSRLYSWSGSAWVDCGDIKGPKGDQGIQGERGPTGPAGTTTWAGITGKPTLGALSAKDKVTIADFDGDIDLGSTT